MKGSWANKIVMHTIITVRLLLLTYIYMLLILIGHLNTCTAMALLRLAIVPRPLPSLA